MRSMKYAVMALAAAAFVGFTSPASAQGMSYGVVDMNKILQTADAAKGLFAELEAKRKEFQTQIAKEETALRTTEQEIIKQKEKLTKEQFEVKRKEFEGKVTAAQKTVQSRKETLDKAFAEAMGKLRVEILKVSADVAKEKGYNAVFSQEAMVLADQKMDITKEVIEGVNKSVKKIPVEWKK
jgi:outer membrane protein